MLKRSMTVCNVFFITTFCLLTFKFLDSAASHILVLCRFKELLAPFNFAPKYIFIGIYFYRHSQVELLSSPYGTNVDNL